MDESSRTFIRRRGFLLGAAFALLVGMLIAIGIPPASGEPAVAETRQISLDPPEVGAMQPFNGRESGGTLVLQRQDGGAWVTFNVHGLNCRGQGVIEAGDMFYTIYVGTATTGLFRVYNFNTGCNFGDFKTQFVSIPQGVDIDALFSELVTIDIVMEADDGIDGNVWPFADFVLRGMTGGEVVGESTVFIPRADSCGEFRGRTCESLVGDVLADAMRARYNIDFAFYNSGGIRDDLTCPVVDDPIDSCPSYIPPNFPITPGQIADMLFFNNNVFTVDITGPELKAILENGVSMMPNPSGRFGQWSGLCFTYNIGAAPGTRITSVVRQDTNGVCTADQIDLSATATYSLAMNSFDAQGNEGYPDFIGQGRGQLRDKDRVVLAAYIAANSPISPTIDGRITCTGGASCPVVLP